MVFDAERRIWRPEGGAEVAYRESVEVTVAQILGQARDRSSTSPELERHARGWSRRYHLSAQRSQLLRGLELDRAAHVLEIGAGCGAITRFLGEHFAQVTAVEGASRRAQVCSARVAELGSVDVIAAPIQDLAFSEPFPLVTSIGVLEYAGRFFGGAQPYERFLELLRGLCRDDGALLLAIENQFGLKYFAGAPEDHTGIRYDGIEGYPSRGAPDVATFSRPRLQAMLHAAGFAHCEFLLPFPDYKFPAALLREDALREAPEAGLGALIEALTDSRGGQLARGGFDPSLAWQALGAGELLGVFANSFLVIASPGGRPRVASAPWDAVLFSTERLPQFWTQTTFTRAGRPDGCVEKRRIGTGERGEPAAGELRQRLERAPWLAGERLDLALGRELRTREASWEGWLQGLAPWVELLRVQSTGGEAPAGTLPGEWLDAVPRNLMRGPRGELALFDREWIWPEPLPLAAVVARGLFLLLSGLDRGRLRPFAGRGWLLQDALVASARALLGSFERADLAAFVALEARVQERVSGRAPREARRAVRRRLARPFDAPARLLRRSPLRFARQQALRCAYQLDW